MPKQINEIKDFLLTARRKDAKCAPETAEPHLAPAPTRVTAPCPAGLVVVAIK